MAANNSVTRNNSNWNRVKHGFMIVHRKREVKPNGIQCIFAAQLHSTDPIVIYKLNQSISLYWTF